MNNFITLLEELGIKPTNEQLDQLRIYQEYLVEYNSHTNLTAITKKDEIYLKHFYDSLTIVKAIDLNNINTLIDVGTGAGFPGMVLKIIFPHLHVTLLDSNNKKTTFLSNLVEKLGLINIEVINTRSEDSKNSLLRTADSLTSELEEILTFVDITDLNSKVLQLRDNTAQLTGMVSKNFGTLNEFLNTQITNYNKLGEEAAEAAANVSSNIG